MKEKSTILLLAISLCFPVLLLAETVVLKSGKIVEGKLIETTNKYIKIDFQGIALTYFLDEIESIDGVKQVLLSAEVKNPSQEDNTEIEYYNNEDYGIKIQHPKDWEVFDRKTHPEVFESLLTTKPLGDGTDLICAFSCGKDWDNLNPLIMVAVQRLPENLKGLTAKDLAKIMDQNLRQTSLPPGNSILEYPSVIEVSGRKLIRYLGTGMSQDKETKTVYYAFVKGTKLYQINGITDLTMFDSYSKTFRNIAGSIEAE